MKAHFQFQNIRKVFGQRTLLAIDELSLEPGQCTALTGHNGAGKTTLLKILAGLDTPQQALISHEGGKLCNWQCVRKTLRREVIYLHQFAYMFDGSVTDNVTYGLARQGVAREQQKLRAHDALAQVGLSHLSESNAKNLSGGERQRVAMARALVLNPKLLLLDEPTASMDRAGREQILLLLRQLKEYGLASIIVSHDVSTLDDLPDRYIQLDAGKLQHLSQPVTHNQQTLRVNNIYPLAQPYSWRGANA